MSDRVALVTGSTSGIGAAIARRLARDGYRVALHGRRPASEGEVMARDAGAASYHAADLSEVEHAGALVRAVLEKHGRLDVLVNNAGESARHPHADLKGATPVMWRRMMDVNVTGIVTCTRAARQQLAKSGAGVVINQSSIASEQLDTAYAISKLAVRGLTVALARELASDNIRVCGIAPGLIATDQLKAEMPASLIEDFRDTRQLIRKVAGPEDLAGTLLFLCSNAAQFITGETIIVAGGYMPRA